VLTWAANAFAVSSSKVQDATGIDPSTNVTACLVSATPFWNEKSAGGFGVDEGGTKAAIFTVYVNESEACA